MFASRRVSWQVSECCQCRSCRKWHDTRGDTSLSEAGRGGSMRPRRRCFWSSTRGSKRIDCATKTGTTGMVMVEHLQSFHRAFIIEKIRVSLGVSKTIVHRPSTTSIYVHQQWKQHVPMTASSRQCHDVSENATRGTDQAKCGWRGILRTVFECLVLQDLPSTPAEFVDIPHDKMRCDKYSRVDNRTWLHLEVFKAIFWMSGITDPGRFQWVIKLETW